MGETTRFKQAIHGHTGHSLESCPVRPTVDRWTERTNVRFVRFVRVVRELTRAANSLRRMLESVGIQRRQKDITPSLASYLAAPSPIDVECE
jgi:hypothetical protein